jgi:predicted nucleic acid-binding protein
MKPYADTNFLARLYLDIARSDEAIKRVGAGQPENSVVLPVIWLHHVELINTIQFYVFLSRQGLAPRITPETAQAAQASFNSDMQQAGFLAPAGLLLSDLQGQYEELSLRHTAKHGFRTYDVLHVASALLLGCDEFWSFDEKALKLAELEGLSPG